MEGQVDFSPSSSPSLTPRKDASSDSSSPKDPKDERRTTTTRSSRSLSFEVWNQLPEEVLLPRSEWIAKVMQKHPDCLELRERLRYLYNFESFGRDTKAGRTEVKETLSHAVVTQIIYQFLKEEQLTDTLKTMNDETGIKAMDTDLEPHVLNHLLKLSVRDMNALWTNENDAEEDEQPTAEDYNEEKVEESESQLDIPVLDEPDNQEDIVVFDNILEAATLNKLILWLFHGSGSESGNYLADKDYKRFFLVCYHSFTTTEKIFNKLTEMYSSLKATELGLPLHILNFIKYWVEIEPDDFKSEKMLTNLKNFIDSKVVRDKQYVLVKQLRTLITKIESAAHIEIQEARKFEKGFEPKVPRNIFSSTLTLDDIDEEEIARQLTLIDFGMYKTLHPSEFFLKNWYKSKVGLSRAPNITKMINRFSEVAKWVATEMVLAQKSRHLIVIRFLKICEALFRIQNFHSLMAIYSGLTSVPVAKVWNIVRKELPKGPAELLKELNYVFGSDGNYQNYRVTFAMAQSPCIPFLGVHLRDLSFLEEAYLDIYKNMINFAKKRYQTEVVLEALKSQGASYSFQYVHQIAVLLRPLKFMEEAELLDKAENLEVSYENS